MNSSPRLLRDIIVEFDPYRIHEFLKAKSGIQRRNDRKDETYTSEPDKKRQDDFVHNSESVYPQLQHMEAA